MKAWSTATAPGSGTASGFAITTYSRSVAPNPWFAFAANESGPLVLEHARPLRQPSNRAGDVRDDDELVDLRRQSRERVLELGGMAVRDDDSRDHGSSSR